MSALFCRPADLLPPRPARYDKANSVIDAADVHQWLRRSSLCSVSLQPRIEYELKVCNVKKLPSKALRFDNHW
jgi:hypothetical protein